MYNLWFTFVVSFVLVEGRKRILKLKLGLPTYLINLKPCISALVFWYLASYIIITIFKYI